MIAALIVTIIVGLLIEHYVFSPPARAAGGSISATVTVIDQGEGTVIITGPPYVPEDHAQPTSLAAKELLGRYLSRVNGFEHPDEQEVMEIWQRICAVVDAAYYGESSGFEGKSLQDIVVFSGKKAKQELYWNDLG